jgi:hypothetical protein
MECPAASNATPSSTFSRDSSIARSMRDVFHVAGDREVKTNLSKTDADRRRALPTEIKTQPAQRTSPG